MKRVEIIEIGFPNHSLGRLVKLECGLNMVVFDDYSRANVENVRFYIEREPEYRVRVEKIRCHKKD